MAEFETKNPANPGASFTVESPEEDRLAREAGKVNAMADASRGLDPFQRVADPDYDPVRTWVEELGIVRPQQLVERRSMLQGMEAPTAGVDQEMVSYKEDMQDSGLGVYRQQANMMIGDEDVTPEVRDEAAFAMKYALETADLFQDYDLADTALDMGGLVIPFNETATVANVARELGFTKGFLENAASFAVPGNVLERMQEMAASLEPDDRAVFHTDFSKAIDGATSNKLLQKIIKEAVFDQTATKTETNIWNALDIADTAVTAVAITQAGVELAKTGRAINMLRRIPTEGGHKLLRNAASEPELSKVLDVTPADMSDLHTPGLKGELSERLVGASDDSSARITAMIDTQDARMEALNETSLKEGILTPERQSEVMMEAEQEILKRGYPTDVEFTGDHTGFSMTYKEMHTDPDTSVETVSTVTETRKYVLSDIGDTIADVPEEYTSSILRLDPNSRFKGKLRIEMVSTAESLQRSQGQHISALNGMLDDAYKPLNRKQAAELDGLLMRGSSEAKEYSFADLKSMGFSDKISEAYMGQRNVSYKLYDLENQKAIEDLQVNGAQLVDTPDGQVAGRMFDDPEAAFRAYKNPSQSTQSQAVSLFDETSDTILMPEDGLDIAFFRDMASKGYTLARAHYDNGVFKMGDEMTQWAFVQTNSVRSAEGAKVLNRIDGYVPKSRTDGFFFVKGERPSQMHGASPTSKVEHTVAWADNINDATAYAKKLGANYTVRFDREMAPGARDADMISAKGGLFGGKRKEEELLYVGTDDAVGFESSLDMMQRYVNHVARQTPSHLWRIGTEQRFLDRARSLLPEDANITNPYTVMEEAGKYLTKTSDDYKYLHDLHTQLASVNRVPTTEEKALMDRFQNIGNRLEGSPFTAPFAKHFYRAAQRNFNPADQLRGLTFTHMLGMFNPSQLLVQASGAYAAFSVNPVSAIKALPKTVGWQALDALASDPLQQKRVADWMRANDMSEYADSYMIWAKSGFRESVTDANADFATVFGRKPYTANVLQRLGANNTMFYEMGELAMSRASVATAVEWYKDANKLTKVDVNDARALKEIYNRAEKYRLNMSKANRSDLNRGLKAVPFQFQQVISKYFEKVLPKNMGGTDEFTAAEKMRLFAIPTATFGAATIPFGTDIVEGVANLVGVDLREVEPDVVEAVRDGAFGWLMSEGGMNVDFGSRMSLPSDILGTMLEFAGGGGGNVLNTMMGPSGNTVTRYTQGMQYIGTAFDTIRHMEDVSTNEAILMAKVVGDALAGLPSSTRNMRHYLPHILSQNPQFRKNGKFMWEWEDMNTQTAVLAAWGFQPTEQVDLYNAVNELRTSNRAEALQVLRTDADVMTQIMSNALRSNSAVENKVAANISSALLRMHGPVEQTKILQAVKNNMHVKKHDQRDIYFKLEEDARNKLEGGLNLLNKMVSEQHKQFTGGK